MIASARRLILTLCLLIAAAAGMNLAAPTGPALALPAFSDAKYAAIVVDASSGEVLFAKRADSPRYPASITKIMTLYLAFEAIQGGKLRLTDTILVSPHAAAQAPSKLGVPAGERVMVEDAIRAICVKSANDIAVAMAERLGGTESRFSALMTLKAQELGMSNTRYVNASGLPDSRQLTSARDIAILSRAMMRDFPQFYPYFSLRSFSYRGQTMRNHNGVLFAMPGVDGLKTGFTNASGFNLSASAVRDGRRLIAVVMGGPSARARDAHVEDLLATGFDVLRRRAAGEQISVAQNYFERASGVAQEPAAPVSYAALVQSQAAPAAIEPQPASRPMGASFVPGVVTAAPVNTRVFTAAMSPPPPRVRPARIERVAVATRLKKKAVGAEWGVQVGSFRQRAEARGWLKETARRFGEQLDQSEARIIPAGGWYRTRFEGLTKPAAGAVCRALHARHLACELRRED